MDWLGQGFWIGDCEVVPVEGTVRAPHGMQRIGPRPMALLTALAERPGQVISRDELMVGVWRGLVVSDETLSRCISDLRQALGDDPRTPCYIETLARRGYRLIVTPRPLAAAQQVNDRAKLGDIVPATEVTDTRAVSPDSPA